MKANELKRLYKKVFIFDTSEADERFFRKRIVDYLNDKAEDTLTKTMRYAIWERNDEGKTFKYMYFNDRSQYISIDRDFFSWAKLMCQQLNEELALTNKEIK